MAWISCLSPAGRRLTVPKQRLAKPTTMVDRLAKALAKADDKVFAPDPARYRRLALAALKTLTIPTEAMIDAAHAVVWFVRFTELGRQQKVQSCLRNRPT
jgi:hypothetical protein